MRRPGATCCGSVQVERTRVHFVVPASPSIPGGNTTQGYSVECCRGWPLYTSDAADELPCVDPRGHRTTTNKTTTTTAQLLKVSNFPQQGMTCILPQSALNPTNKHHPLNFKSVQLFHTCQRLLGYRMFTIVLACLKYKATKPHKTML